MRFLRWTRHSYATCWPVMASSSSPIASMQPGLKTCGRIELQVVHGAMNLASPASQPTMKPLKSSCAACIHSTTFFCRSAFGSSGHHYCGPPAQDLRVDVRSQCAAEASMSQSACDRQDHAHRRLAVRGAMVTPGGNAHSGNIGSATGSPRPFKCTQVSSKR